MSILPQLLKVKVIKIKNKNKLKINTNDLKNNKTNKSSAMSEDL